MNTYGPQTRPEGIQGSGHKPNSMLRDCGNQAVEERLQNIEAHLRLQTGKQSAGQCPNKVPLQVVKLHNLLSHRIFIEHLPRTKHASGWYENEQSIVSTLKESTVHVFRFSLLLHFSPI